MNTKENSTSIYCVDQILIPFLDKKGHIAVDENCDPKLVEFFNENKTIPNMFKLTKSEKICPVCKSKLHVHITVEFEFNNSILMLDMVSRIVYQNPHIYYSIQKNNKETEEITVNLSN